MAGTEYIERVGHWAPGEQILWRYRGNGPLPGEAAPGPAPCPVHICRPVTVVQDTDELLAVWVAPGTECVKPVLADGTEVHDEPLATRYTAPRTTARSAWLGNGVLKLARPGDPWSVWLFWDPGWRFRSWYVNLEEPRTRWAGGVDSEDHFLDISVYPDHSWVWRDEDEFARGAAGRSAGPADRSTGAGGGPRGRRGHPGLGRAVPGRLGELAARSAVARSGAPG